MATLSVNAASISPVRINAPAKMDVRRPAIDKLPATHLSSPVYLSCAGSNARA